MISVTEIPNVKEWTLTTAKEFIEESDEIEHVTFDRETEKKLSPSGIITQPTGYETLRIRRKVKSQLPPSIKENAPVFFLKITNPEDDDLKYAQFLIKTYGKELKDQKFKRPNFAFIEVTGT